MSVQEMEFAETTVAERVAAVRAEIARACERAGRSVDEVTLVAVSKTHAPPLIVEAVRAGVRDLGENRPEEAAPKMQAVAALTPEPVCWHMIGHVQSRKSKAVAAHFDWLHSLDREKLALRLERDAAAAGRTLPVLLECNVSGEQSKFGWPAWQEERWDGLLEPLERVLALPHLQVRGLMTMAPFFSDPQQARPYFNRLRRLRDFLAAHFPQADWSELSMGMSGDFEAAVQEGATIVRIGTAIMGPRPDLKD